MSGAYYRNRRKKRKDQRTNENTSEREKRMEEVLRKKQCRNIG